MRRVKEKGICSRCGNKCSVEEFKHSENGRYIQAMWCRNCNADYARYKGENYWQLIYQSEASRED